MWVTTTEGVTDACSSASDLERVFEITLPFLTLLNLSMACMSSTCSDNVKDCCQGCADGGQGCTRPYCHKSSHAESKEHTPTDTLRIYIYFQPIDSFMHNLMHTSALKTPAGC